MFRNNLVPSSTINVEETQLLRPHWVKTQKSNVTTSDLTFNTPLLLPQACEPTARRQCIIYAVTLRCHSLQLFLNFKITPQSSPTCTGTQITGMIIWKQASFGMYGLMWRNVYFAIYIPNYTVSNRSRWLKRQRLGLFLEVTGLNLDRGNGSSWQVSHSFLRPFLAHVVTMP
jgi:hypothetical protein